MNNEEAIERFKSQKLRANMDGDRGNIELFDFAISAIERVAELKKELQAAINKNIAAETTKTEQGDISTALDEMLENNEELRKKVEELEKERDALIGVLGAWQEVFGTTQLTHAQCIRETNPNIGEKSFNQAIPYANDCLRYFSPFMKGGQE